MKMSFTYDDFIANYIHSEAMRPINLYKPVEILDYVSFSEALADYGIDERIRKTHKELGKRMGEEYYSKFERVQTRATEIGSLVFPAYKMLFLDITCEDWLSLVDFHKGFNRDHSIHQPLTAYIVCKLLGGGKSQDAFKIGGQSILDKAVDVIMNGAETRYLIERLRSFDPNSVLLQLDDPTLWRKVFYQTAIITAMYHDMGYPWQFMEGMHKTLDDEGVINGKLRKGHPIIEEYIDHHNDELMFRPFYDYGRGGKTIADINRPMFEDALHKSHGLPGAIAFDVYNKKYRSDVNTEKSGLIKFCQEWSCLAILMHDMEKAYAKGQGPCPQLDFNVDPLSYIIALADTLEDFNRPSAKIDPTGSGCKIDYTFPSLNVELEEDQGRAIIRYSVVAANKEKQEKFKTEDQSKLFDQPGYFNLLSIGLNQMEISVL